MTHAIIAPPKYGFGGHPNLHTYDEDNIIIFQALKDGEWSRGEINKLVPHLSYGVIVRRVMRIKEEHNIVEPFHIDREKICRLMEQGINTRREIHSLMPHINSEDNIRTHIDTLKKKYPKLAEMPTQYSPRICIYCEQSYIPASFESNCCSRYDENGILTDCQRAHRLMQKEGRKIDLTWRGVPKICKECNEPFFPIQKHQKFCNEPKIGISGVSRCRADFKRKERTMDFRISAGIRQELNRRGRGEKGTMGKTYRLFSNYVDSLLNSWIELRWIDNDEPLLIPHESLRLYSEGITLEHLLNGAKGIEFHHIEPRCTGLYTTARWDDPEWRRIWNPYPDRCNIIPIWAKDHKQIPPGVFHGRKWRKGYPLHLDQNLQDSEISEEQIAFRGRYFSNDNQPSNQPTISEEGEIANDQ